MKMESIVYAWKYGYVRAEKPTGETKEGTISIENLNGESYFTFELENEIEANNSVVLISQSFRYSTIYFDLDKSVIRKDAAFLN
jgi:hypothetical protein